MDAAPDLNAEILTLYQQARAGDPLLDFKPWAMGRAAACVPMDSANWVDGVMTPQGPVSHESQTLNMAAGYWAQFSATLRLADPIGARMFATPGTSLVVTQADFPPASAAVIAAWGIASAVIGMVADRSTGTFSVVVWHRGVGLPPFGEAERRVHEQLLPHWVEGLQTHRVGVALRDLDATALTGHLAALVEPTGLVHYAQVGFGELLREEFDRWTGGVLPQILTVALAGSSACWDGPCFAAARRTLPTGLWLVHLRRHVQSARPGRATEQLLRTLDASLHERDEALAQATAELHEQRRRQAVLEERQRIMRELHDGLGADLIGLLNLAASGNATPDSLAGAINGALDELRLTVDAAHVPDGDLPTLLGNLRYRLQPRLDAAGIAVAWEMPEMTGLPALSSTAALHLQRIVLEAVTNVLRHSGARRLWVSAALTGGVTSSDPHAAAALSVCVADDGIGANGADGAASSPGRGQRYMRERAAALGAALDLGPRDEGPGLCVRLRWPLAAMATAARAAKD